MKKILCLVFLTHLLTYSLTHCLYAEVKISRFSGAVSVYQNQTWVDVKPEMVLSQQDKIKTGHASRAVLTVDETSIVIVNENSEVEMASIVADENVFSLLVGKVRAKVKLIQGKKFTVKTPVSVCAVRGTEFIATSNGELYTLEGTVEFANVHGVDTTYVEKGYFTAVGPDGKIPFPTVFTDEQMSQINLDWAGLEEPKIEKTEIDEKGEQETKKEMLREDIEALRQELHQIVADMKTDIEVAREMNNEIKEADFATGRTLKDIHGNLVRVEQHLLRPDSKTLQFLNLTKRDSYVYGGKFKYDGPSGSRLDVLETKVTFNKSLPDQITEWPGFIAGQDENTFYPQSVCGKLTNQTDKIEFIGVSKDKGELDEEGKVLMERSIVTEEYINGWEIDTVYDAGDTDISKDGEATGDLWATNISPKIKIDKDGQTKYVSIFSEIYGINNDGKLLNLNNFTSTSENPFTVLKEVAVENILSVREGNTIGSPDFFAKGNIDLVVTPDIVVSIAQKLATEAGNIADSIK
ncbi:MAG: FecR domain-containing protein [Elusimicrobia bacterium]|nr:FecR domain-containing protein [Elusimicrobiota bacterium]